MNHDANKEHLLEQEWDIYYSPHRMKSKFFDKAGTFNSIEVCVPYTWDSQRRCLS